MQLAGGKESYRVGNISTEIGASFVMTDIARELFLVFIADKAQ